MLSNNQESHESFGLLKFSRISRGGSTNLFGSSIKHSNTIELEIYPAKKERSLNNDYYFHDGIPYITVEMSPSQFAEAITSMNYGTGIPVTIRDINGKTMEECPEENMRQTFEAEFANNMGKLEERMKALTESTKEILSSGKAPTKKEKEEILNELAMLEQEIRSNIPFVQKQFNRQMDKTVLEAKGEIEGFVQYKINSLGVGALKEQFPQIEGE